MIVNIPTNPFRDTPEERREIFRKRLGIGLEFSVRELFEERVTYSDVLFVVSGQTKIDFSDDQHWQDLWDINMSDRFSPWFGLDEYEKDIKCICLELHKNGKIHQPYFSGGTPLPNMDMWLETSLIDDNTEEHPAVKEAREQYELVRELVGQ